jgi:hypothetical protein
MYRHGSHNALCLDPPYPRIMESINTPDACKGCMDLTHEMMIDFNRVRQNGVDAECPLFLPGCYLRTWYYIVLCMSVGVAAWGQQM